MNGLQSAYEYRIWVLKDNSRELTPGAVLAAPPTSPLARLLALAVDIISEQQVQDVATGVIISATRRGAEQRRERAALMPDVLSIHDKAAIERLSVREREVLSLIAQGAANSEIAARLGLSLHTVKRHISNILSKLHAANRTQAVTYARAYGVLNELSTTDQGVLLANRADY